MGRMLIKALQPVTDCLAFMLESSHWMPLDATGPIVTIPPSIEGPTMWMTSCVASSTVKVTSLRYWCSRCVWDGVKIPWTRRLLLAKAVSAGIGQLQSQCLRSTCGSPASGGDDGSLDFEWSRVTMKRMRIWKKDKLFRCSSESSETIPVHKLARMKIMKDGTLHALSFPETCILLHFDAFWGIYNYII